MSATGRSDVRQADDFYRTQPWVVHAIVPHLPRTGLVLDVGCGDGAILESLVTAGYDKNQLAGIELHPGRAAKARAKGFLVAEGDYLAWDTHPRQFALAIGNPPYSLALDFALRIVPLAAQVNATVALLLRLGWLASKTRQSFHLKYPSDVHVLPRRPEFVASIKCKERCGYEEILEVDAARPAECPRCGESVTVTTTDASEYAWFVWGPGRGNRWSLLSDGESGAVQWLPKVESPTSPVFREIHVQESVTADLIPKLLQSTEAAVVSPQIPVPPVHISESVRIVPPPWPPVASSPQSDAAEPTDVIEADMSFGDEVSEPAVHSATATTVVEEEDGKVEEAPKRRGRPRKEAAPAPAADAPKPSAAERTLPLPLPTPPSFAGPLPAHVISDLGTHPAVLTADLRTKHLQRAFQEGLLDSSLASDMDAAWIRLQYRAPVGWFKQTAPPAVAPAPAPVPAPMPAPVTSVPLVHPSPMENLSELVIGLGKRGINVSLMSVVRWQPADRQEAWRFVRGELAEFPQRLF